MTDVGDAQNFHTSMNSIQLTKLLLYKFNKPFFTVVTVFPSVFCLGLLVTVGTFGGNGFDGGTNGTLGTRYVG